MPFHLSFHEEATIAFLSAFGMHQRLSAAESTSLDPASVADCVRTLALSMEKGLKHAVARIDPYLLIASPGRPQLLRLRKDLEARPVPSIFCSREHIETINLLQTWEALRELRGELLDVAIVGSFEQSLKRLVMERNRAYHSEVYSEATDLLGCVSAVLARFRPVAEAMAPDWFAAMCERNGQLLSRLKGLEAKVSADWQVLVDYLVAHECLSLDVALYATLSRESLSTDVLIGAREQSNNLMLRTQIPYDSRQGLFSTFLTQDQIDARHALRRPAPTPEHGDVRSRIAARKKAVPQSTVALPMAPLQAGSLEVPPTAVWLSLHLPGIQPPTLDVQGIVSRLLVEFPDGQTPVGSVSGRLEGQTVDGGTASTAINLHGIAVYSAEWCSDADPNKQPPEAESTVRSCNLQLKPTVAV